MPEISYYFGKSDGETRITSSDELALYLLDKAHVATVGGDAFGAPECIRISYATSDDLLIEAVKRIKGALERLQ
jgi:aspartate aminotransferase